MSIRCTLSLLLGIATSASADIIYVNTGATGAANGTSWADAYPELRDALPAAAPGDENWVAQGTYTPAPAGNTTTSFVLKSGVALYGGFAGHETLRQQRRPDVQITTLSGDVGRDDVYGSPVWWQGWNINTPNSLHILTATGVNASAVLDGFTITAGRATQSAGGGIWIESASPTISNCNFWRDLAAFGNGGGIVIIDGSPTISSCTSHQNWVHLGHGGGIYVSGASSPVINDCVFSENRVYGATPEATGGAISSWSTSPVTIERSTFSGNFAAAFYPSGGQSGMYGGAIHNLTGEMHVTSCRFTGNSSNAGGAFWTWGDATLTNCFFSGNSAPEYHASQGGWGGIGGAIGASSFAGALLTIRQCTIVQNTATAGGGIRLINNADADINGCILWANSDTYGSIGPSQIRGTGATRSCIQNMLAGIPGEDPPDPEDFPECFADNPLFVSLASGDFHLDAGSPCIDRGDNTSYPGVAPLDLDGLPRFVDDPAAPDLGIPGAPGGSAIVDLGCFERQAPCYPNCDGSTVPPVLNVDDFTCFINQFAQAQALPHAQQLTHYANCDHSTIAPALNVDDFTCFINEFAEGCP